MTGLLLGLFLVSAIFTLTTFIYRNSSKLTVKSIYVRSCLFVMFCFAQIGYGIYAFKTDNNVFQSQSEIIRQKEFTTKQNNKKELAVSASQKKINSVEGNKGNSIFKMIILGIGILIILIFQFVEYRTLLYLLNTADGSEFNYSVGFWSIPLLFICMIIYVIFNANLSAIFIISSVLLFLLLNIIQIRTVCKNTKGGKILFLKLSVFYLGYLYLFFVAASFIYLAAILFVALFLMSLFSINNNYRRY